MATIKAGGYRRTATSAQAYQAVHNRHVWDVAAAADGDKVLLAVIPAGHRLELTGTSLVAKGAVPAMTYDLCVATDAQKLVAASAVTAATFKRDASTAYALAETIGVDFENDRDVYLLLTDAPEGGGGQVVLTLVTVPQSSAD